MQGDVVVQVAEDVSQLLLRHDGELQHGVMVRLQKETTGSHFHIQPG